MLDPLELESLMVENHVYWVLGTQSSARAASAPNHSVLSPSLWFSLKGSHISEQRKKTTEIEKPEGTLRVTTKGK